MAPSYAAKPERPNHVWSYDFVFERTVDGRTLQLLTVIDKFTFNLGLGRPEYFRFYEARARSG